MTLELIRGLYDYHWWANRCLFAAVAGLGEEAATREVGKQFSWPSLKGMFAHIYGADYAWLQRWKGSSPSRLPRDADFASLADLRARWDTFEKEQRQFIGALAPGDLGRVLEYTTSGGERFASPLWQMLQHVPNHGTHHRSEVATMITMVSGSPPATDLIHYYRTAGSRVGG